uniref:Uncharacterized protein n=1 Tax=Anopheles coluzzii TaxID=1518534 RepID=A0A6E8W7A7_ANOCL|nr:uncharacterized protein LOC120949026 [Anopheles coluzzii]
MTVSSVKHPNVLPQPAAASSARVTAAYDYNGTGSSGGIGGGIGASGGSLTHGGVGSGSHRSSGLGSGRISPHSPANTSSAFGRMRPSTKRCLFDIRPDPIETKRVCDDHAKAERQRTINRYGFDPYSGRGLTTSSSSSSSGSSSVSSNRHHHQ